jgi:dihydrofolate reductase
MEDPGGAEGYRHGGWSFTFDRSAAGDKFKLDELTSAEAQLLGRVTYEGFAAAWPSIKDGEGFADRMNSMPKYVVSKTLRSADWKNSTILSGDPAEEVTALKRKIDGDILVAGSAQLVHLLAANDLVDEYRLMIFPILLGSGKRVFADAETESPPRFEVTSSERSGDVQMVVLQRAR